MLIILFESMDFCLKIHSNENEAVIQGCYNCRWLTVIYNTSLLFTGQSKVADVCFTYICQAFLTALSFLLLKVKLMHEYFMFWRNRGSVLEIQRKFLLSFFRKLKHKIFVSSKHFLKLKIFNFQWVWSQFQKFALVWSLFWHLVFICRFSWSVSPAPAVMQMCAKLSGLLVIIKEILK